MDTALLLVPRDSFHFFFFLLGPWNFFQKLSNPAYMHVYIWSVFLNMVIVSFPILARILKVESQPWKNKKYENVSQMERAKH